ncbi:DUF5706 domain-containing protein [Agromyces sp. H3Y2-19a]|uniref:Pycsar system effector family protein n=1 Tax=Agromyces chromiiresistens TaxID=3030835 RepID=UPI0023B8AF32|nr:Pycsar system effector family protein [Agromyces chromiiresistens]MDF0513456.1 DUF5706 domain-containing protein [Agromyces chromiiresistens]
MRPRRPSEAPSQNPNPIDTAWRIHAAQTEWTGKVDAKASFAFALESAAIATVVALSAKHRLFSALPGHTPWLYWSGLMLLVVGAGLAVMVVAPRLRGRKTKSESATNFIYFGHARNWKAIDLEASLRTTDMLPQLSRQITAMAKISWKKHVRVQWSLWSATLGGLLLVACGLIASFWPTN